MPKNLILRLEELRYSQFIWMQNTKLQGLHVDMFCHVPTKQRKLACSRDKLNNLLVHSLMHSVKGKRKDKRGTDVSLELIMC